MTTKQMEQAKGTSGHRDYDVHRLWQPLQMEQSKATSGHRDYDAHRDYDDIVHRLWEPLLM